MAVITKTRKPVATILIVAMVVSLLSGVGLLWNRGRSGDVAAAEEYINTSTGVINVPSATGALGTETNPFVILEIVPSEDMAQAGYLVEGQEPVNVTRVVLGSKDADGNVIPADDTAYDNLGMFLTEDFQNPKVVFEDEVLGNTDLTWIDANSWRTRYGYFEKIDAEYKAAHADEDVTYYKLDTEIERELVAKRDLPEGSFTDEFGNEVTFASLARYNYVKVTPENKANIDAAIADAVARGAESPYEELLEIYDLAKEDDGITGDAGSNVLYKNDAANLLYYYAAAAAPGMGNFSTKSDEYDWAGLFNGKWSLLYKWVGKDARNRYLGDTLLKDPIDYFVSPYTTITKENYSWTTTDYLIDFIIRIPDRGVWNGTPSTLENPIPDGSPEYSVKFEYTGNSTAKSQNKVTYRPVEVSVSGDVRYLTVDAGEKVSYYDRNDYFGTFKKYYYYKNFGNNKKPDYRYVYDTSKADRFVYFVQDDAGDYTVSETPQLKIFSTDKASMNLRYYKQVIPKRFEYAGSAKGDYTALTTAEKNNYTFADLERGGEKLGEYDLTTNVPVETTHDASSITVEADGATYLFKADEQAVVSEDGVKTKIRKNYSRDYDKYVFTDISLAPGNTGAYAVRYKRIFDMKVDNENGDYVFVGKPYGVDNELTAEESIYISDTHNVNLENAFTYNQRVDISIDTSILDRIPGYTSNKVVFGYDGIKSNEIFKKYSLGLAYKNNDALQDEDTTDYEFKGWYYEPECVNKLDQSREITANTNLYANWKYVYTSDVLTSKYYTINFNGNKPDDEELEDLDVDNLPDSIEYVYAGDRLVMPDKLPRVAGYRFKGWYLTKEAADNGAESLKFNFEAGLQNGIINAYVDDNAKILVLHAGWEPIPTQEYAIEFDSNMPGGVAEGTSVTGMPSNIGVGGALRSGYLETGFVLNKTNNKYESAKPAAKPTMSGYQFEGWYYEPECLNRFVFDTALPQNVIDALTPEETPEPAPGEEPEPEPVRTITLYAHWIANSVAVATNYTITFKGNEPNGAIYDATFDDAEGVESRFTVKFGSKLGDTEYTSKAPGFANLDGNAARKIRDYKVQVITVTPDDFRIDANLALIDRANLIIINQSCNDDIKSYWRNDDYRNEELFPQMESGFKYPGTDYGKYHNTSSATKVTFVDNDLPWKAAFRLYKKVAGVEGVQACPMIFDYSIFADITFADEDGNTSACATTDADGMTIYNNNTYKLYLMTQEMHPVTLYNAYIKSNPAVEQRFISNTNVTLDGRFGHDADASITDMSGGWNTFSLIPASVLTADEWTSNAEEALAAIGFNIEVAHTRSALHNRVFIYNNETANVIETIANSTAPSNLEVTGQTEMNEYMHVTASNVGNVHNYSVQQFYRTGQVIYYLLHNRALYQNASASSINILEIQPSNHFREEQYWFWYVSRYIPDFIGTPTIRHMCTTELVGNTEDLNSKYDIIYVGADDTALPSKLMPVGEPVSVTSAASVPKIDGMYPSVVSKDDMNRYGGTDVNIPIAQILDVPYYRLETVDAWEYTYVDPHDSSAVNAVYDAGYQPIDTISNPVKVSNGNAVLNTSALSVYINELGLEINRNPAGKPDKWYDLTEYYWEVFGIRLATYRESATGLSGTVARVRTRLENGSLFLQDNNQKVYKNVEVISTKLGNKQVNVWVNNKNSDFKGFLGNAKWSDMGGGISNNPIINAIGTIVDVAAFAGQIFANGSIWFPGDFEIQGIYRRQIREERWVYHDAGTKVYAGDVVRFLSAGSYNTSRYVYASAGAMEAGATSKKLLLGTLGSSDSITTYVYSGNDITGEIYDQLIDFINAGLPVIIDADLMRTGSVNTNIVGQSSRMYSFLTEALRRGAFVNTDRTKEAEFKSALAAREFTLTEVSRPVEYNGGTYMPNDASSTIFKVSFSINASSAMNYKADLYFDINGDGVYDKDNESIDSLDISYIEPVTGIERSAGYNPVLSGGRTYVIRRDVTDYIGVIPWKLVVTELDGSGRRTSLRNELSGMCAYKESEKKEIHVIQVVPDYTDKGTMYLPTEEEIAHAVAKNGELAAGASASTIENYFSGSLHPYDNDTYYSNLSSSYYNEENVGGVRTKWLKINASADTAYDAAINSAKAEMETEQARLEREQAELDEANLKLAQLKRTLVDIRIEYNKTTSVLKRLTLRNSLNAAENAVRNQENTVRVHQDRVTAAQTAYNNKVTNYNNKLGEKDRALRVNNFIKATGWLYYYTTILEDYDVTFHRLGVADLTRLGALAARNRVISDGGTPADSSDDILFSDVDMVILGCAESAYTDISNAGAVNMLKDFIASGKTVMFTYNTLSYCNLTKSTFQSKNGTSAVYWGYNNTQNFRALLGMDRYGVTTTKGTPSAVTTWKDTKIAAGQNYDLPYDQDGTILSVGTGTSKRYLLQGYTNATIMDINTASSSNMLVTTAKRSSSGQITNYPYQIPDTLNLARTHSAYYQLDLESDDMTVWYILSDDSNEFYRGMDVRNNYYMYSYGNLIYSGIGQSSALTDDEIKLFINAIIASFSATAKAAVPELLNSDRSAADSNTDYIYIDYDATLAINDAENKPFGDDIYAYGASGNLTDGDTAAGHEAVAYYAKRVKFELKSYSIVPSKQLTMFVYPVRPMFDDDGNITGKAVDYDHQMKLPIYYLDTSDNTYKPVANRAIGLTGHVNEGLTIRMDSTDVKFYEGAAGETMCEYYVDIPITDYYYDHLGTTKDKNGNAVAAIYADRDEVKDYLKIDASTGAGFGLNAKSNNLEIAISVVMRFGRDSSSYDYNIPLVGQKNLIVMRRGMFTLD